MKKITKNNVSYFIAGYKACLADQRIFSSREIEHKDYTTVSFINRMKELLRAYDLEEHDKEGLEKMYDRIGY